MNWSNDHELFALMKADLFSAVIRDIDGVWIIPKKLKTEIVKAAFEKGKVEKTVQRVIEEDVSVTGSY